MMMRLDCSSRSDGPTRVSAPAFVKRFVPVSALAGLLLASTAYAQAPCTETVRTADEHGVTRDISACITEFSDDFEAPFAFRVNGWHKYQFMGAPTNAVVQTTERVHSGKFALKATTGASRQQQKACVARELMHFADRSEFWMSAWYYIVGGADTENLFLFDLESTRGAGNPGRRLMLTGPGGNWLMVESKRAGGQAPPTGTPVDFPKDRWVNVKVHYSLSAGSDGLIEVWQDGRQILNHRGANIPSGLTYDWIEIGITSNVTGHAQTVYVDDLVVSKNPIP